MGKLNEIRYKIHTIRGKQVLLDRDLAMLYEVETKALNQAVKRNSRRFPSDFMFQLTHDEIELLRSQNVTATVSPKSRSNPYAFTEQGVAMLSGVLKSATAIDVNIGIMRTFIAMKKRKDDISELSNKIEYLEQKYNKNFQIVFDALHHMFELDEKNDSKQIGFKP